MPAPQSHIPRDRARHRSHRPERMMASPEKQMLAGEPSAKRPRRRPMARRASHIDAPWRRKFRISARLRTFHKSDTLKSQK